MNQRHIQRITMVLIMLLTLSAPSFGANEDAYENDDTYDSARKIVINLEEPQQRNFHEEADVDWIKFYGFKDVIYDIKAVNKGTGDLVLELYDAADMSGPMIIQDGYDAQEDEILSTGYLLQHDGIYYVKLRLYNADSFSENTAYDLTAYNPEASGGGTIYGVVKDATSGDIIVGTDIFSRNEKRWGYSENNGEYHIYEHPAGAFELIASHEDVLTKEEIYLGCLFENRNLSEDGSEEINIGMIPVNLSGLVLILRIITGNPSNHFISREQDIDGDERIGLAEAICILQKLAELPCLKE